MWMGSSICLKYSNYPLFFGISGPSKWFSNADMFKLLIGRCRFYFIIHPCKKFFILVSQTCERNHLVCFTKGLMQTQHISSLMVKKNSMIINKCITSWFSFAFAMIYQWAIIIRVCNWTGYTQFQDRPTWKTGSGTSSCWHWSGNRFPKFGNGLNRSGNRFQVITHLETGSWTGFGTSSQTNFVSRSPKPFFFLLIFIFTPTITWRFFSWLSQTHTALLFCHSSSSLAYLPQWLPLAPSNGRTVFVIAKFLCITWIGSPNFSFVGEVMLA